MNASNLRDEWDPGLDNDALTLGEVLETLPGDAQGDIPFLVKLFESPASPIAVKGAIGLDRHDCVHVLLGRGLTQQDEAFVIGYTMGASKTITAVESWLYGQIRKYIMAEGNRFDEDQRKVYALGIEVGKRSAVSRIATIPLEAMRHARLGNIRAQEGIDKGVLREAYRRERELVPHTRASRRLPV